MTRGQELRRMNSVPVCPECRQVLCLHGAAISSHRRVKLAVVGLLRKMGVR